MKICSTVCRAALILNGVKGIGPAKLKKMLSGGLSDCSTGELAFWVKLKRQSQQRNIRLNLPETAVSGSCAAVIRNIRHCLNTLNSISFFYM